MGRMFHWMLMPYRRYADFNGRSQRMEFWLFTLFYYIVLVLGLVLTFAGLPWGELNAASRGEPAGTAQSEPGPLFWGGLALMMLFLLGSIIPSIAVTVRRFHDQDRSGWLYLLHFVPYIGWLAVMVFMCLDGTPGPNRFGDDPKAKRIGTIFE